MFPRIKRGLRLADQVLAFLRPNDIELMRSFVNMDGVSDEIEGPQLFQVSSYHKCMNLADLKLRI